MRFRAIAKAGCALDDRRFVPGRLRGDCVGRHAESDRGLLGRRFGRDRSQRRRRTRSRRSARRPAQRAGRRHRGDAERQGLLARGRRRRGLHVRRRTLLRLRGKPAPQRAHRRHRLRRQRLLARGGRWWRVHLRGRTVLRLRGKPATQRAHRRRSPPHRGATGSPPPTAASSRMARHTSTAPRETCNWRRPSSASPPLASAAATGWPRATAVSSPTATPASSVAPPMSRPRQSRRVRSVATSCRRRAGGSHRSELRVPVGQKRCRFLSLSRPGHTSSASRPRSTRAEARWSRVRSQPCIARTSVALPDHSTRRARWRVDVGVDSTGRGTPCFVVVNHRQRGSAPTPVGPVRAVRLDPDAAHANGQAEGIRHLGDRMEFRGGRVNFVLRHPDPAVHHHEGGRHAPCSRRRAPSRSLPTATAPPRSTLTVTGTSSSTRPARATR